MRVLMLIFLAASNLAAAQTKPADSPISGKVGYLDVESLISKLPEYGQLQAKMQETRKQLSDDLFKKEQGFQIAYNTYLQDAKQMSDTTRATAEGQLQQLDSEIRQLRADAENTLENTKKLYLSAVYLRLAAVLKEVASENGFIMILPYTVGNAELLLHSDSKFDVSPLVLKKMTDVK